MSAQSLSLSVKMFLHHCQSSLGTIRNIQRTVFPDKTTVLNAALQLVDPYIFTLPSDSSCFYICVIIPCAKMNLFLRHPQNKCKIKAHTHVAHAHVSREWLGYGLVHSTQVLVRAFQVIEPFWSTLLVQSGCFHELSSEHLQPIQKGNHKTTQDNKEQDSILNKHSFHSCSGTTEQQQTHIYDVYATVCKMALLIEPFICLHNL